VRALIADGSITAIHDVSDGGIAVSLAEMAIAGGVGANVRLERHPGSTAGMFFGEDQAVYVVTTNGDVTSVIEKLNEHGVVGEHIGMTGGESLVLSSLDDTSSIPLADLRAAHEGFFPALMGADAALA
jgi:phosphoribosylformylglycinamidine synthase